MLLCLGNSTYHLHVPDLTRRHGGVVLAHDVRMTALHGLRAQQGADPKLLSKIVCERHGPELGSEIEAIEIRSPAKQSFAEVRSRLDSANALLLGAAVPGAQAVLVHSDLAARLARLELRGTSVPVTKIPFGHPPVGDIVRKPVSGRITSFGMVAPQKRPEVVIEALAHVRQRVPHATLRFVGQLGTGMVGLLASVATSVGVKDRVSWSDRVDEPTYRSELGAAEIAVQLRRAVNGEASAAVADCIAAGIPTIVTAIGAHSELPGSAVAVTGAGCSAQDVATSIERLLTDEAARTELTQGGTLYAKASSFEVAANAVTEVLMNAPPLLGIG
jgi:glycosyltransferase involved in cell wall biosynthesis